MSAATPLRLAVGFGAYDHTRDLVTGAVRSPRLDLRVTEDPPEAIFRLVEQERAFDVAEFSLAKYVALRGTGADDLTAIPVFPSRVLRQSSVYVRADSELSGPADLGGGRVGVPEWVQTAGVWARGWLQDDVGVPLASIAWFQGGVDAPGRQETVRVTLPAGVEVTPVADRPLDGLLQDGGLDAIIAARPPASFVAGRSRRLIRSWRATEGDFVARRHLFPIMHVVVVRSALLAAHSWLADELVGLFEDARRRSVVRMSDHTASRAPVPWLAHHLDETRAVFGDDPFAYGLAANLATLQTFLAHCRAQGIAADRLTPGALFPTGAT